MTADRRFATFLAAIAVVAGIGAVVALAMTALKPSGASMPHAQQVMYVFSGEAAIAQREIARAKRQISSGHLEHVVYYGGLAASPSEQAIAEIQVSMYEKVGVRARAEPHSCIVGPPAIYAYESEMEKAIAAKLGEGFQERVAREAMEQFKLRHSTMR